MFVVSREEIEWAGCNVVLETGKMARQADGAVMASMGGTVVLATVVSEQEPKPDADFLPLTVQYQEKSFAAGRIPGGYFRREGRPSEHEILVSRLIDRPVRPLFSNWYRCDTQLIATVLSHDMKNSPDIVAMIASFAALAISGVPIENIIGGARVGYIGGEYVLNPTLEQQASSKLDLVVAGTEEGVYMVESEAKELSEDVMLGAVQFGYKAYKPVISAIERLTEKAGKARREVPSPDLTELEAAISSLADQELRQAYSLATKQERSIAIGKVKSKVMAEIAADEAYAEYSQDERVSALKTVQALIVRSGVIKDGTRIDGRSCNTIRPISVEAGILPRVHGSALFTRGETQALVVATLGAGEDEQFVDALEGTLKKNFLLHYNFPPFSVGETGRIGSPGRREIGHGKLAWRAINPVLPSKEEFPYTIRVVSEITESDASSSMATVCASSLALTDAGVKLKSPVAGVSMGLIFENGRHFVLSDILGDEDGFGDMDFKVAGTMHGITALQMDVKIQGVSEEVVKEALEDARKGINHILGEMDQVDFSAVRVAAGGMPPCIKTIKIPVSKIRLVIGAAGKVIREIIDKTGAKIDVKDDGSVNIFSSAPEKVEEAVTWIQSIVAEPEVGVVYNGTVVKCMEFGAFVNFFGAKDGLVHISELATSRVDSVGEVVNEGDKVRVKFLGFDKGGRVRLSMKNVDQVFCGS